MDSCWCRCCTSDADGTQDCRWRAADLSTKGNVDGRLAVDWMGWGGMFGGNTSDPHHRHSEAVSAGMNRPESESDWLPPFGGVLSPPLRILSDESNRWADERRAEYRKNVTFIWVLQMLQTRTEVDCIPEGWSYLTLAIHASNRQPRRHSCQNEEAATIKRAPASVCLSMLPASCLPCRYLGSVGSCWGSPVLKWCLPGSRYL
ncbi:hypothetical protein CKAH01_07060 [Colletotrichum kahawae]|uniref:Uncharacterized protein n=1 Tax=Colletotrichum kahawae TaxID=34407 RepID=A0AAD9Y6L3_COLKA|nr:hypothetical protein CKAH01_07060 [Colletotrichum kahawae]